MCVDQKNTLRLLITGPNLLKRDSKRYGNKFSKIFSFGFVLVMKEAINCRDRKQITAFKSIDWKGTILNMINNILKSNDIKHFQQDQNVYVQNVF